MQGPRKLCPQCQTPAPMNAAVCARCGRQYRTTNPNRRQQPQAAPSPTYQRPLDAPLPEPTFHQDVGGWLARNKVLSRIAFAFVLFLILARPGCGTLSSPPDGTKSDAVYAAHEAVRSSLKAPSTAKFVDQTAETTSPGKWMVVGQVDAQNSFGAMLRNTYVCILTYDRAKDEYRVDDLAIR